MNNRDVAAVFDEIADLLEFQNANPFRVRAYRNAARRIGDLAEPLERIAADPDRDLTDIEGIGKDLAEKIAELLDTGSLAMLEELRRRCRPACWRWCEFPAWARRRRPRSTRSSASRRSTCSAPRAKPDEVQQLKGFGKKTQEKILAGIDLAAKADERMYWADADEIVQELLAHMRQLKGIRQIEVAGSYRRGRETIGDLDLLVDADDADAVMDQLAKFEELADGDRPRRHEDVDPPGSRAADRSARRAGQIVRRRAAILHRLERPQRHPPRHGERPRPARSTSTASSASAKKVAESDDEARRRIHRRQERGRSLCHARPALLSAGDSRSPPGVRLGGGREAAEADRADRPRRATCTCTPPPATARRRSPRWSPRPKQRGLKYIAITDHSPRVSMANGLDPARLREQWEEIDRLNRELDDFIVLKGIECDILEKGGMDLPDDVLAEADWVIASVHYGQQQPREQITDRILGALENPHVSIIAHPTGRLIDRREPYAVDLEQVFAAAKKHGKLLEINANPARLDLDDVHCAAAKRHGIPIVISSDAHSTGGLDVLRYGVLQARRGGLTAADVANTRPWTKIKKLLRRG